MTREDKRAYNYARDRLANEDYPVYSDEYELKLAYKAGVSAAIQEVCEWLDCYIDNYLFIDAENKAGIRWDDFINDFRKAMKEE